MTLLTIVQDTCRALPLTVPTSVIDNTDPQVAQLLYLLKSLVKDLMANHEWNELITNWEFTTTADPHTETFPTARQRAPVSGLVWRQNSLTPLVGPINSNQYVYLKNHVAGNYPGYWRNQGGGIQIIGIGSGEVINTEYISNEIWLDTDETTTKSEPDADTDTIRMATVDDDMAVLGLIWRWRQRKGLNYAEDMQSYELRKQMAMYADNSAKPVSYSPNIRDNAIQTTWHGQIITS